MFLCQSCVLYNFLELLKWLLARIVLVLCIIFTCSNIMLGKIKSNVGLDVSGMKQARSALQLPVSGSSELPINHR